MEFPIHIDTVSMGLPIVYLTRGLTYKFLNFDAFLSLNNLEKRILQNQREPTLYEKKTDSILMSLFMRTNRTCNNSHAPQAPA